MSRKINLPDLKKHTIVCFHYDPMRNKRRVVLQVPTEEFHDSDTYDLDLDSASDTAYILGWKNGLRLLDKIKLHGHVAYKAAEGECLVLEETNARTTSRFYPFDTAARRGHHGIARRPFTSNWKVSALWSKEPQ